MSLAPAPLPPSDDPGGIERSRFARPFYYGFAVRHRKVGFFAVKGANSKKAHLPMPPKSGFAGEGRTQGGLIRSGAGPSWTNSRRG
jgi:hypothetical protein